MDIKIRPMLPSDAQRFWEIRREEGVFENMLGLKSNTLARVQNMLENPDPDRHSFCAVIDTEKGEYVVGQASLGVNANPRLRHSASIGIMVDKDYQGMGVGSALMNALLELADNWLMLIRVELGVYPDNDKGLALYNKFGFKAEGVKKYAAVRDGKYIDEVIMGRINPHFSKLFE